MRHGASALWSEGQWAALTLIASSVVGHVLPDAPAFIVAALPPWLTLMLALPLLVMVPVLVAAGARAGWRARSAWTGLLVGAFVSGVTTCVVIVAYVIGLALGQPQLLRIGFGWESLRDIGVMFAVTAGFGITLAALGSVAGAACRLAFGGDRVSLSR